LNHSLHVISACLASLLLAGCLTAPQVASRPILTCADCKELVYNGPAPPAAKAPGVQLAETLVSGAVAIAGYGFTADALKSTVSTAASAGQVAIVEQPAPTVFEQRPPTVVQAPDPVIVPAADPIIVDPVVVRPEPPIIVRPQSPPSPAAPPGDA
jgi:hypothetical protein